MKKGTTLAIAALVVGFSSTALIVNAATAEHPRKPANMVRLEKISGAYASENGIKQQTDRLQVLAAGTMAEQEDEKAKEKRLREKYKKKQKELKKKYEFRKQRWLDHKKRTKGDD